MSRPWQLWPPQPIFVTFTELEFLIWCALINLSPPDSVCLLCLSCLLFHSYFSFNITRNGDFRQIKMNGWEEEEQPVMLPSPWPRPWHSEPQMADMTEDQVLQSKPGRDKNQQAPRMMNEFCSRKKPSWSYHDTWALVHRPNTRHIT